VARYEITPAKAILPFSSIGIGSFK
jgi:hypothetical protein